MPKQGIKYLKLALGLLLPLYYASQSLATNNETPVASGNKDASVTTVSHQENNKNTVSANEQPQEVANVNEILHFAKAICEYSDYELEQRAKLNQQALIYSEQIIFHPSCNLHIATRDYRAIPAYQGLSLNLSSSWINSHTTWQNFYVPLLKGENKEANKTFLLQYLFAYNAYAPQAKYALIASAAPNNYGDLTLEQEQTTLSTTAIFITRDGKVYSTDNHVLALSRSKDGFLQLNGEQSIALTLVDLYGRTNQSGITTIIHNQSKDPISLIPTLNTYLDQVLVAAKETVDYRKVKETTKAAEKESGATIQMGNGAVISGGNIQITSTNGSVVISGGKIQADSVKVSGDKVAVNNVNIDAQREINLDANKELNVAKSDLQAPNVIAQAPIINDDGSLRAAVGMPQGMTNLTIPRIVGIENYFMAILQDSALSLPVIDPYLTAQILGVANIPHTMLSFSGYQEFVQRVLSPYLSTVVLNKILTPYAKATYKNFLYQIALPNQE